MSALFILEAVAGESSWVMEGLTALISGMGGTFAILILIAWIISLFKYIKKGDIKHEHKEARINAVVEEKPSVTIENGTDDLELIAVITAAIAASLNTTTDQLQVRSLRRVSGKI